MRIAAVVVTFNRLRLLKECIASVKQQTVAPESIFVVDNSSTDGTEDWLRSVDGVTVIRQTNSGCSGGVFSGIVAAISGHYDWVWVMDDDTVCFDDTLEQLLKKLKLLDQEKVGFLSSKSIWMDNSPHLMNLVEIRPYFNNRHPFNKFDHLGILLTESCSFVSVLINLEAVKSVGLPYKEFFIWEDDVEFTKRISKAGYFGFYCSNSIVIHKTPMNYSPDIYSEPAGAIWKFRYGYRNKFFIEKRDRGFLYFIIWLLAKVVYLVLKISFKRRDNRRKFIGVVLSAAWASVFFNPSIVMFDDLSNEV